MEYGESAESRFDAFDGVMDWALAEGVAELWVWSHRNKGFEQSTPNDHEVLRREHQRG